MSQRDHNARSTVPRAVVVTRPTDYERLIARHGTKAQAQFFLQSRGGSITDVVARHDGFTRALDTVMSAIPASWRRSRVDRGDLDRFLFEPDDVVVALGQDGLVANVAKYLAGQPVIGVNPAPDVNEGILVPHAPKTAGRLLAAAASGAGAYEERTMIEATLDDGQRLLALNEIFVGHRTHQSARYRIAWGDDHERQSSSGLIVASGTGATGWARSIHRDKAQATALPAPLSSDLVCFVREAWPSVATGTTMTQAAVPEGRSISVTSEMDDDGVVFGDGIESDRLEFHWGRTVVVKAAATRLRLILG